MIDKGRQWIDHTLANLIQCNDIRKKINKSIDDCINKLNAPRRHLLKSIDDIENDKKKSATSQVSLIDKYYKRLSLVSGTDYARSLYESIADSHDDIKIHTSNDNFDNKYNGLSESL
jgi:hypothetical protein